MSTAVARNIPLPSGYTVVERLGAGGYGEVWKAIAPGGVEKAIKLVFGQCDEGIAERELKALERIKSVRHPFVLSIERYEIVDQRLVIVTELADMSLQDAFQRVRAEDQVGIPRARLISYLWDAADALDCLVDIHSLQHLDIKPENLLVVGDHVKVADFGLVKQLATQTLHSMMGGITPLYSAPEIFDDNPSSRSDQYSLAIVYQQMLTGTLPFPGRTPAQLAKQHTLAVPNLRPLSEADQRIVGKALAKNPSDRFASCREFVSALRSLDQNSSSGGRGGDFRYSRDYSGSATLEDTTPVAESDTALIDRPLTNAPTEALGGHSCQSFKSNRQIPLAGPNGSSFPFPSVDSEIHDVEVPNLEVDASIESVPTLFVGVGGLGVRMLKATHGRVSEHESAAAAAFAWLAIDTDRKGLVSDQRAGVPAELDSDDLLHVPLRRPKQYRDASQNLLQWVSRRWLYNIPRSLQTRGYRPLGRIAIVDHAEEIVLALKRRVRKIALQSGQNNANSRRIRVVLLGGMSGGTGSGTIVDVAQAVRSICRESTVDVEVHAILGCTFQLGGSDSLAAANMFALLKELNHVQAEGNRGMTPTTGAPALLEHPSRPFDEIYTVGIPKPGSPECESTLQSIADYLLLEANSSTGKILSAIRSSTQESQNALSLRTFNCIALDQIAGNLLQDHQQQLLEEVVAYWAEDCTENFASATHQFSELGKSRFAQAVAGQLQEKWLGSQITSAKEPPVSLSDNQKNNLKQIAAAFSHLLSVVRRQGERPANQAVLESIGNRVVERLSNYVREQMDDAQLGQRLFEMLADEVERSTEDLSVIGSARLADAALAQLPAGPLDCGYQRRTLLFASEKQEHSDLSNALKERLTSLTTFPTTTTKAYLLQEGDQVAPLDLGSRIAETYPDIDEAAARLHTRCDIRWRGFERPVALDCSGS